jgi:tRNA pseudouridine65 synthase
MLEILYQDEYYIAVHKPTGLFVHPTRLGPEEPSCMPMLRDQIGRWVYPVHRLDRATSGVLLFGLSSDAARRVAERFEDRSVDKRYLAVVRGYIEQQSRID